MSVDVNTHVSVTDPVGVNPNRQNKLLRSIGTDVKMTQLMKPRMIRGSTAFILRTLKKIGLD
jgi:hypothetical protein